MIPPMHDHQEFDKLKKEKKKKKKNIVLSKEIVVFPVKTLIFSPKPKGCIGKRAPSDAQSLGIQPIKMSEECLVCRNNTWFFLLKGQKVQPYIKGVSAKV